MTSLSDDFTRANETPVAGNWSTGITGDASSVFNLSSGALVVSNALADASAVYTGATWGNDQSSKADLTVTGTAGGGSGVGLWVRRATGAKTGYRFIADHAGSTNCELAKFVANTFTSLLTFTQAWTNGDTWELRVIGSTLTIWLNGSQIQSTTDSAVASGGFPGAAYSSTDTSASVDNWIGTDSFGGAAAPPPRRRSRRRLAGLTIR